MNPNEQHLEFIQNSISRMNQCSFQMKGWAIAAVSALIAVYVSTISETNTGNKMYLWIALAPVVLFWVLDAFYLSKEYKFIGIYNNVAGLENHIVIREYEMPLNKFTGWHHSFWRAFIGSASTVPLYGALIIGLTVWGIAR